MMNQTPEERDRLLDLGKDGIVMCIDLDATAGREAVAGLARLSEEVRGVLTVFGEELPDGFLLALYIIRSQQMVVTISTRAEIRQTITLFHDRALQLGNTFSFVIIPANQTILNIVADLTMSGGAA